jgi:UDP-N-acetylmuramyl pentapeptide phosphotransferase/UDP-N-acetylglucosamine-1-phosphate transferase
MTDLFDLTTILLMAMMLSMFLAVPIIYLLYKFNITRRLDVDFSAVIDQRQQKAGTPVMGGLIFVVSILVLNLIFNLNGSTKVPLLVFVLSALLGAADDILNIHGKNRRVIPMHRINKLIRVHANTRTRVWYVITYPWQLYKTFFYMLGSNPGKGMQAYEKILINSIAGVAVFLWVYSIPEWTEYGRLFFPFDISLNISFLMLPFIILTVLVMSNAVNIADGMDGLSAGMILPAFMSFMTIAILRDDIPMAIICATAIGGITAYLYFNIPPARVQMGDVGSLSLGTLLAVISLEMRLPFLLTIICFPFLLELASSLIQGVARRVIGQRVFLMAPLHHHFELLGWREEKVVMRFWLLAIFCAILGVWTYLLY